MVTSASLSTSTALMPDSGSGAATLTVQPPPAYNSGDFLLMVAMGAGTSAVHASTPSGWTAISAAGAVLGVFYKTAAASEPAYTVTFSGNCQGQVSVTAYPPATIASTLLSTSGGTVTSFRTTIPGGITSTQQVVLCAGAIDTTGSDAGNGISNSHNMNLPATWAWPVMPFGAINSPITSGLSSCIGIAEYTGNVNAPLLTSNQGSTFYSMFVILTIPAPANTLQVTATAGGNVAGSATYQGVPTIGMALTVKAVTGAQTIAEILAGGETATSYNGATGTTAAPQLAITPKAGGSIVYGAVTDNAPGAAYTVASNTTFSQNVYDSVNLAGYGTFRSTTATVAGTPVTLGGSAPATAQINVALAEILAAASSTLTETATAIATGINPADFTTPNVAQTAIFPVQPAAGTLLVAQVSVHSNYVQQGVVTMSLSDTLGLTWTALAQSNIESGAYAGIWVAQLPAATTGTYILNDSFDGGTWLDSSGVSHSGSSGIANTLPSSAIWSVQNNTTTPTGYGSLYDSWYLASTNVLYQDGAGHLALVVGSLNTDGASGGYYPAAGLSTGAASPVTSFPTGAAKYAVLPGQTIEVQALVNPLAGIWPSIFFEGVNGSYGTGTYAEIDFMESGDTNPDTSNITLWGGASGGQYRWSLNGASPAFNVGDGNYHTYRMQVYASSLEFFIDGVLQYTLTDAQGVSNWTANGNPGAAPAWPFAAGEYVILVAQTSSSVGTPAAGSLPHVSMLVDYVRIWEGTGPDPNGSSGGGGGGGTGLTQALAAPFVTSNASGVTTASFTPTAGTLLVAIAGVGNGAGVEYTSASITDSSGSGSWTLLSDAIAVDSDTGLAWVWARPAWTGAATVTFTVEPATVIDCCLQVLQFTDAAPVTSQPGAVAGNGGGSTVQALSITPTVTGSQVVGGFGTAYEAETLTPNSTTSSYGLYNSGPNGDTEGCLYATASSVAGTAISIGFTNAAEDNTFALVEILPAAAATGAITNVGTPGLAMAMLAVANGAGYAAAGESYQYTGFRFWGEVSSWPPLWDSTQTDIYCQITVSGPFRRYVQGAAMGSVLRQYYTALFNAAQAGAAGNEWAPYAYWPCEDASGATELSSAFPGIPSMTFTGAPALAGNTAFGGSDALPAISASIWTGETLAAENPPGAGSILVTSPGTYYWICPPGVTAVTGVIVIGAGGGGGDQNTSIGGGGGGGGGTGTAGSVAVSANGKYTYIVPAGGGTNAGAAGSAGANGVFTGAAASVTGFGGSGGQFGGSGGAGGPGATFTGGAGGGGSTSAAGNFSDSLTGIAGGTGSASNNGTAGGTASKAWTAPLNMTGSPSIDAYGAGAGGQGGGAYSAGDGGGGGGAGGYSTGTSDVNPGGTLTFYAGNGGTGGYAGDHGGNGGNSYASDNSVTADGGTGGSGAGSGGAGGNGTSNSGGSGGSGASPGGGIGAGGGGGGGATGVNGQNGQPAAGDQTRIPGPGGGDGAGGGWGSATYPGGSGNTVGGNAGSGGHLGGGGGGGGSSGPSSGSSGGGGGPGWITWSWTTGDEPTGGGGGSSAGTSAGGNAGSPSGPGGAAPTGGGAGGAAGATPMGLSPGGGGAGAVPANGAVTAVQPAGQGGAGSVAFSWSGGTTSPVAADIIRFCLEIDSAGAVNGAVLLQAVTYGTVTYLNVTYTGNEVGTLTLTGLNAAKAVLFTSSAITIGNGVPVYVDVELTQNGSGATWLIQAIEPGATSILASSTGTVASVSVGYVSTVNVDPAGAVTDNATAIGQITVQTYADTLLNLSPVIAGYAGETAAARMERLCTAQGLDFTLTGNYSDTPPMGPQQDDTFMNVITSCADLDRGQLFETRGGFGVSYRTRVNMQGQNPVLAVNYAAEQLAGSLAPTADDQFTRNDITLTRSNGASYRNFIATGPMSILTPPNGVGDYTYSLTVFAYSDAQLAAMCQWMLTVGSVNEYRYPQMTLDLSRSEVGAVLGTIAGLDVGDFIQVYNQPAFLQQTPIDQLAWGYTETLNAYIWSISFNTVPESPYSEGDPPTW